MIIIQCGLATLVLKFQMTEKTNAKKFKAPKFDSLISPPWAKAPQNSYYGDPGLNQGEQQGLESVDRNLDDEEGTEQVVIKGYN